MASKIKLNNNQGDTITLEHSDTISSLGSRVIPLDNITHKVSTIAELRAMTERPEFVYVEAYDDSGSTYGAFGSHFFKRSLVVEADNGGTVIQSVNDTYELQYEGAVNVKWFGAVGDGTNATAAFIAAIQQYSQDISVYIPDGTYLITSTLGIGARHTIVGETETGVVINFDSSDDALFACDALNTLSTFTINNITATGVKTGIQSLTPTDSNGMALANLSDITITDFDFGIGSSRGLTHSLCFDTTFTRITFNNIKDSAIYLGSGANNNTFTRCLFNSCATAIRFNNVTTQKFINCAFENCTTREMYIEASNNIDIDNCYFEPAIGSVWDSTTGVITNTHCTDFAATDTVFLDAWNTSDITVDTIIDTNYSGISAATQSFTRINSSFPGSMVKLINAKTLVGTEKTIAEYSLLTTGEKLYHNGDITGTDANGDYIKYPNGYMECRQTKFLPAMTTVGLKTIAWTFPHSFSSGTVSISGMVTMDNPAADSGRDYRPLTIGAATTADWIDANLSIYNNEAWTGGGYVKLRAFGTWK